jgi:putative ABC transport system substrate-binding protein
MMRGLTTGALMGAALLCLSAWADQPSISRIGVLVPPLANSPLEEGLREGLRGLGYSEGKNIVIEWRRSAGVNEEMRSLAADLARAKVEVIVVYSTRAARAAVDATNLPVVFVSGDPVASGLAASLARPGGNATGVSGVLTELTGKRLQLLRLLVPQARRIACLINSSSPLAPLQFEAAESAARTLGVKLVKLDARNDAELDAALHTMPAVDGVLVTGDSLFLANRAKLAGALRKAKLPAIFPTKEYQGDGVLMSYGPSLREAGRKMALYVDKILKGAKPADLPIEQISNYELVIDLRAARELSLKVPQDLLLSADEVIR